MNLNNPSPSSSIPMSNYQDLWLIMREIEQIDDDLYDQVQQGAQGSSHDADEIQHPDHHHQAEARVEEGSSTKKLDHNAKERVRRMKLNTSYLALSSLLPDSRKPKEKWSAAYVIDRALDYIPKLEDETDKLTVMKNSILSVIQKQQELADHTLTLSINEVIRGELIIQICQQRDKLDHKFSTLIEKLEGEDIQLMGASSLSVSQHRSCFHLHIQMFGENPVEADYVADLHNKLISWLS